MFIRLKKRRGFILIQTMLAIILMIIAAYSLVEVYSGQFVVQNSVQTSSNAYWLGQSKAHEIDALSYSTLLNYQNGTYSNEQPVTGTQYDRKVTVGSQTSLGSGDYELPVTINVYKTGTGEATPLASVQLTPTSQESSSSDSAPVGTIIIWPSSTLPSDGKWLICNGQSTSGYSQLAAIVGSNVPDYQGYFLRGLGGNSAGLGVAQGDAIRDINGYISNVTTGEGWTYPSGSGAFNAVNLRNGNQNGDSNWMGNCDFVFDAGYVVPTANENRPINKAVLYLIKAIP